VDAPRILTFARFYLPGYLAGGPIQSLSNLIDTLGSQYAFHVVCLNADADGKLYEGVTTGQWSAVDSALVQYSPRREAGIVRWAAAIKAIKPDVIYLNSFFDPIFTLYPLIAAKLVLRIPAPIIVAPRGEFSPGALAIKARRKRIFLSAMKYSGLFSSVVWQACSELEKNDIEAVVRNHLGLRHPKCTVAHNLTNSEGPDHGLPTNPKVKGALRVVFLSRISEKKNLLFAIDALKRANTSATFDIYGPVDDANYWARCQEKLATLPRQIEWKYRGPIPHDLVGPTLAQYDLMLLPTKGENFGHVIWESMNAGVPVLISDRTPWGEVEKLGAGWALRLDVSEFISVIQSVAAFDEARMLQLRASAKAAANRTRATTRGAQEFGELIEGVLRSA
jgi:glycosyltransferase involved in cell wall biosynthesis